MIVMFFFHLLFNLMLMMGMLYLNIVSCSLVILCLNMTIVMLLRSCNVLIIASLGCFGCMGTFSCTVSCCFGLILGLCGFLLGLNAFLDS